MTEEIKEILENFKIYETRYKLYNETQFIITHREINKLSDYITNLQQKLQMANDTLDTHNELIEKLYQENERLEENNQAMQEEMARTWKMTDDYKSRCEKAIEYIKMYKCDYSPYELTDSAIRNVLNILNGSDEE